MTNIRLRVLSYIVIAYMLMAFTWWSVLLWKTLDDAFQAKSAFLKIGMIAEGKIRTEMDFYQSREYNILEQQYTRQQWMVAGEGLFFVISLVVGVWLINRGYNKEVYATRQSRNFLLSITHELKSPIASIKLILETFRKRRDKLAPEQLEKLTNSGLREADRLNILVNDLLLSAKLETAYQIHADHFNLDELLEDMVQKLDEKYPAVDFQYQCTPRDLSIHADKMGLTSVFINLLENAVKYSKGDQQIRMTVSEHQDDIRIEVADNGIGISDQEKGRIFDKFYRVGSEDTRTTKGTGLGLFIVKEIIKVHGGRIQVSDNKPKGTVFSITLPKIAT
ncbi:sensor histidine kinase [Flavilitoribacter nigricans]|uniref:histidine kinase n=1 Tax=Flavilitoribacter nigricans (strain ATCC 23147 / DSM 23189 / NBRC 102662 / NCIMB 1420 / SS-2) TaxID=1122177 RepID=A0A2D0NIH4_FLAN2|nr:HAMP domain-containing sensor histidine kinase [Flavilitoribacter nigricans]PHN07553.1 two-component sensor histidine kinase [Flavilitoribacter nigricans DSM 23189 = NBRC 102662]